MAVAEQKARSTLRLRPSLLPSNEKLDTSSKQDTDDDPK
jgi:hypothetical protein